MMPKPKLIEANLTYDRRGFSADQAFPFLCLQTRITQNYAKGALRGMHFQKDLAAQAKLIRVLKGEIYDVTVDMREESPNFLKWEWVQLNDSQFQAYYIPPGFAHGFLTLKDETQIFYEMDKPFITDEIDGFRYDDAAIGIIWPMEPRVIAEQDLAWPALRAEVRQ